MLSNSQSTIRKNIHSSSNETCVDMIQDRATESQFETLWRIKYIRVADGCCCFEIESAGPTTFFLVRTESAQTAGRRQRKWRAQQKERLRPSLTKWSTPSCLLRSAQTTVSWQSYSIIANTSKTTRHGKRSFESVSATISVKRNYFLQIWKYI